MRLGLELYTIVGYPNCMVPMECGHFPIKPWFRLGGVENIRGKGLFQYDLVLNQLPRGMILQCAGFEAFRCGQYGSVWVTRKAALLRRCQMKSQILAEGPLGEVRGGSHA